MHLHSVRAVAGRLVVVVHQVGRFLLHVRCRGVADRLVDHGARNQVLHHVATVRLELVVRRQVPMARNLSAAIRLVEVD